MKLQDEYRGMILYGFKQCLDPQSDNGTCMVQLDNSTTKRFNRDTEDCECNDKKVWNCSNPKGHGWIQAYETGEHGLHHYIQHEDTYFR